MFSFLIIFPILFTLSASTPLGDSLGFKSTAGFNIHAVLVAGSNEYYNYRHQADVCHAYQVLRNHGVPAENIIVMMYDDIANNTENPFPGQIFNAPNGPDVYAGVSKDYIGNEVTSENFLGVLRGDKDLVAKGKKVLTSGPNDHVFIYFADHGATGLIGFPTGILSSHDLNKALVHMHEHKLYGKLTFYLEACESGSMFENILPDNINIYATTATNSAESSYGCYYDPKIGTALGDEYSVAWLEDSDSHDLTKETLEQQFKDVVNSTTKSHPQQFGQKSLASLKVGQFQGEKASSKVHAPKGHLRDSINVRDLPLVILKRKLKLSKDADEAFFLEATIQNLIAGRRFLESGIKKIVSQLCSNGYCSDAEQVLSTRKPLVNHPTYSKVAKKFQSSCLNLGIHTHGMKFMYVFANLVESNNFTESTLNLFLEALERACNNYIVNHGFGVIV
uniref:legumain n=1 Tax=Tetranychus urticae TaxID=32264 RepID=T1JY55_TETUR